MLERYETTDGLIVLGKKFFGLWKCLGIEMIDKISSTFIHSWEILFWSKLDLERVFRRFSPGPQLLSCFFDPHHSTPYVLDQDIRRNVITGQIIWRDEEFGKKNIVRSEYLESELFD